MRSVAHGISGTWRNRDGSTRIGLRCVSRVGCGNKYRHNLQTLDEESLHRAILAAINSAVKDKDNIVYNLKAAVEKELAPVAGQQLSLPKINKQLEQLNTEFRKELAEALKAVSKPHISQIPWDHAEAYSVESPAQRDTTNVNREW